MEAFGEHLEAHLRARTYRPQPVRRTLLPNPDGGQRPLGIPAVRDRVVQRAVLSVLEPVFEAEFSPHSHGFRPERSTGTALRELYGHVRAGQIALNQEAENRLDNLGCELIRSISRVRHLASEARESKSPVRSSTWS